MKPLFSLGLADIGKGFLIAVLTVVLTGLGTYLNATPPHFPTGAELGTLGLAGLGAGIAYIIKNFFTNSENKLLKKEPN